MTDHLAMVGYRANINQLKDGWWGLRFKVPVGEGWVGGAGIFLGGEIGTLLWLSYPKSHNRADVFSLMIQILHEYKWRGSYF